MVSTVGRSVSIRRRLRRYLPSAVALLVLASACFGLWYQYPAARTGRACSGMLDVDSVLGMTGRSRLTPFSIGFKVTSRQFVTSNSNDVTEPDGLATVCVVGGVRTSIETTAGAGAGDAYAVYSHADSYRTVPLGAEWQGFMVTQDGQAAVSVMLSCKNWSVERGGGILVTMESPYKSEPDKAMRLKLAHAATATVMRAAEETGCVTTPGDSSKISAPVAGPRTVSVGEESGTCRGVSSAAQVQETDAGISPVEACVLVGGIRLVAQYGPFSDGDGAAQDGKYGGNDTPSGVEFWETWTSASCKGALGVGYYHALTAEGSDREFTKDPLSKSERADLQRFAEQSAARHGCSTPTALSS
ncbi:hypothetical protein [Streptomyces sp. NBC_01262]|uniref:hypothetical protein n=1 Tax=Streptomyces sp. NBC_01262 TaxID=2903803 RepID=UPI002E2F2B7F|nr:hypothetical protein [Streptomyces sp. NBC_01262]